jgi:hypothetical protein
MKKVTKISIILLIILILAIACAVCWYIGFKQGVRSGGLLIHVAEIMSAEQHISDQFENANCEGVKQAIQDYLYIIEKYKDVDDSILSDTVYYADKMISHLRLFKIEEYMGNKEESVEQMKLACDACMNRNWKDCSEDNLISYINRLDEKRSIACLENNE